MRYFVHVDCVPPAGTPSFDPLQRLGVASVFDGLLARLDAVEAPDGTSVELDDHRVGAHPRGAQLLLVVDAAALAVAEEAARAMVEEVLDAAEELDEWEVASCEVKLHDELAQESLAAADGPDAPPSDLGERVARLRGGARETPAATGPDEAEVDAFRARLRALAGQLCHGLDAFGFSADEGGDVSREAAELAAGAVVYAIDLLTDELFVDLVELEKHEPARSVDDSEGVFLALELLPTAFTSQYRPLFVRKFIVAAAAMVERITATSWTGLACTAEALAFRILLEEAVVLDMYGLYDEETQLALDAYKDAVQEDDDHEWLYDEDPDDELDSVMEWFEPFRPGIRVHPYTLDGAS